MMLFSDDDEDDEGDSDISSLSAFDRCICQKRCLYICTLMINL